MLNLTCVTEETPMTINMSSAWTRIIEWNYRLFETTRVKQVPERTRKAACMDYKDFNVRGTSISNGFTDPKHI